MASCRYLSWHHRRNSRAITAKGNVAAAECFRRQSLMLPARLTSSNLHDPILPFVRPVPVALRATQTLSDAHAAIRAVAKAGDTPYFYVLDDDARLVGVVSARHLLTGALDHRVEQVMIPGVVAIPSWATVL